MKACRVVSCSGVRSRRRSPTAAARPWAHECCSVVLSCTILRSSKASGCCRAGRRTIRSAFTKSRTGGNHSRPDEFADGVGASPRILSTSNIRIQLTSPASNHDRDRRHIWPGAFVAYPVGTEAGLHREPWTVRICVLASRGELYRRLLVTAHGYDSTGLRPADFIVKRASCI